MVALGVVTALLVSLTTLIGRTSEALTTATDRDGAEQLVAATLEEARAFACGVVRGDEDASTIETWRSRCWGGLGDSAYTAIVGGTPYTASLHTAWRQIGAPRDNCIDANPTRDRPKPVLAQADLLMQEVTVQWTSRGRPHALSATTYAAVPPDAVAYRETSRGALVLHGRRGTRTVISVGTSPPVSRIVDESGCVLYPFLPNSAVSWTIGSMRGTAEVGAETVTVEPEGVVIA
ncbi:MAG: hypothetical protein ACYDD7_12885 [Acidimicrobiales bacterium]